MNKQKCLLCRRRKCWSLHMCSPHRVQQIDVPGTSNVTPMMEDRQIITWYYSPAAETHVVHWYRNSFKSIERCRYIASLIRSVSEFILLSVGGRDFSQKPRVKNKLHFGIECAVQYFDITATYKTYPYGNAISHRSIVYCVLRTGSRNNVTAVTKCIVRAGRFIYRWVTTSH